MRVLRMIVAACLALMGAVCQTTMLALLLLQSNHVTAANYTDPNDAKCEKTFAEAFASRYPKAKSNLMLVRHSILNIHIGKTCGSTIGRIMGELGVSRTDIHVASMVRIKTAEQYKIIFISIRDPISRTISAFNFHHPLSKGKVDGGGPTPHGNPDFYKCFATVEDYAQALNQTTVCGNLARQGYGHMRLGLCHYVGGVRDLLKTKPNVYVIEQEHCTAQLLEALRLVSEYAPTLVNKKTFKTSSFERKFSRVNTEASLPTKLSKSGEQKLRAHLEDIGEYSLYYELRNRATNLSNIGEVTNLHNNKK